MGLDMYLRAEKYVSAYGFEKDEDEKKQFRAIMDALCVSKECQDPGTPSLTVAFTIAYWRKANAIHKWFIDKCGGGEDDCRRMYVGRESLQELLELCENVLAKKEEEFSQENLPTQEGFFFGETEYGEYYYEYLEYTIERLRIIINDKTLTQCDFFYEASW